MKVDWKDEKNIELVRQMISEGKSASQIGQFFGVTRNSIVGIVFRLKQKGIILRLNAPPPPPPRKSRVMLSKRPREKSPPKQSLPVELTTPPIGLEELNASRPGVILAELADGQCHWPITNDHPFLFCADDTTNGHPYCDQHRAWNERPYQTRRTTWRLQTSKQ